MRNRLLDYEIGPAIQRALAAARLNTARNDSPRALKASAVARIATPGGYISATAVVFMASTGLGLPAAVALAMLFGIAVTGIQGFIIGYFRANGILVSIAVYALIVGITDLITDGQRIYPGNEGYSVLTGQLAGIPIEIVMFVAVALIGQVIPSFTEIGQTIMAVGSSRPAAFAAALAPAKAITWTYVWAGAFTVVAGILLACRYGSGSMEMGDGYDYIAIAAVLVGGNSIGGGAGSVGRTVIGLLIISTIEVVLLLRGFSAEMQHFVSGLLVLGVIALGAVQERTS